MNEISALIQGYIKRLEKTGVRNSEREAKAIVGHLLNVKPQMIFETTNIILDDEILTKIEVAMQQRAKRIPIERIFGLTTFYGIQLHVPENVYKPYPESQDFVEHALSLINHKQENIRILDLGTGTGCILLALLQALPNATGLGTDINKFAIDAAKENAALNNFEDRVEFRINNWADGIDERFDLIVCNPPRVATADLPYLLPEMRNFDPPIALDGGENGVKYFHWLARDFGHLAKENGLGAFQVGEKYANSALNIFLKKRHFDVQVKRNFWGQTMAITVAHHDRQHKNLWRKFRNHFSMKNRCLLPQYC